MLSAVTLQLCILQGVGVAATIAACMAGLHEKVTQCTTYIVPQFTEELVKLSSSLHTVNKERINYRSVTVSSHSRVS